MNVISLGAFGDISNFYLDKIPIPNPKIGEVRILIKAVAFNPVDYKTRKGEYGGRVPLVLGSDCSGIVDAIGIGVNQFAIGDEVYAMPFGQSSNGSYAQYVCLPYQFVAKKPKSLSFEAAACLPLVSLTAYRATIGLQVLNKKDSLFIAGAAGGVGCMAVQLVRYFHGGPIYTIARSEETAKFLVEKLNIEKENIVICKNANVEQLRNILIKLNNNSLFSGVLDFVGNEVKELCISLADYSGQIISTVPEDLDFKVSIWGKNNLYFQKSLSLNCIFVGAESFFGEEKSWEVYQTHFSHLNQLLNEKIITVPFYKNLGPFSVKTVQDAHQLLETGRVKGKIIMEVN